MFALFFLTAHWIYYLSNERRLKERQIENDRLAKENADYKDRFMKLMDIRFDYRSQNKAEASKMPVNEEG